jgi:hypothetical protein
MKPKKGTEGKRFNKIAQMFRSRMEIMKKMKKVRWDTCVLSARA